MVREQSQSSANVLTLTNLALCLGLLAARIGGLASYQASARAEGVRGNHTSCGIQAARQLSYRCCSLGRRREERTRDRGAIPTGVRVLRFLHGSCPLRGASSIGLREDMRKTAVIDFRSVVLATERIGITWLRRLPVAQYRVLIWMWHVFAAAPCTASTVLTSDGYSPCLSVFAPAVTVARISAPIQPHELCRQLSHTKQPASRRMR